MRREALYLADIVEAADAVRRFVEDVEREDFFNDEMRQSAVLQKLIVIGEAAARLPTAFREQHSEVEWAEKVNKRLIEYNLPLADISEASARDKNVRLVIPPHLVGAAAVGLLPRHRLCRAEGRRKEK